MPPNKIPPADSLTGQEVAVVIQGGKLWLGWNPNKRGGNYFPYMFQAGLKRR